MDILKDIRQDMVNMKADIVNMKKRKENKYMEDEEHIAGMRKRKYEEIIDDEDDNKSMIMDEDEEPHEKPEAKKRKIRRVVLSESLLEVDKEGHMKYIGDKSSDSLKISPHEIDSHNHAE